MLTISSKELIEGCKSVIMTSKRREFMLERKTLVVNVHYEIVTRVAWMAGFELTATVLRFKQSIITYKET